MTKKFKKRSLSESITTEKVENKVANDAATPPKKQKLEAVSNANAGPKKGKKANLPQGPANNKKKQEKKKVEKTTPPKGEQKDASLNGDEAPQEAGLNRKERNKLKKEQTKQLNKEQRKVFRREEGQAKTLTSKLSVEQIKEKIQELEGRDTLSKSAKKKLGSLKKILKIQEGGDSQETSAEEQKDKKPAPAANKQKPKQQKNAKAQPGNLLRVQTKADDDEDEDEDEEMLDEEEEEKGQKKSLKKGSVEDDEEEDDDDDDEEVDEDEDEDEEEEEGSEDEEAGEKVEGEEEDDEENEDDDDDEDDEDEEEEEGVEKKLQKKGKQEKKQPNQVGNNQQQGPKKKRYVLHVSNVAYHATADDIKKHFLTKVSAVTDVRIPKAAGTNKPRGFCYVELENQDDYERALSLNRSTLNDRVINVQYTTGDRGGRGNAKQIIAAKNKKFDALRKEGKFAGSRKKVDKKAKKTT